MVSCENALKLNLLLTVMVCTKKKCLGLTNLLRNFEQPVLNHQPTSKPKIKDKCASYQNIFTEYFVDFLGY